MRHTALFAALLLFAVVTVDSWANDSQLTRSVEQSLFAYGRQPTRIADAAMSIVAPR